MRRIYFIIFPVIFLLSSCLWEPMGGVCFLTNGYEQNVMVHTFYLYNNIISERFDRFSTGTVFGPDGGQRKEYSYMTEMQILTLEGEVLAEFTLDYLTILRQVYPKRKDKQEYWVFSERGLFIDTDEILSRYRGDEEGLFAYYCSDEAVQDLLALLEKAGLLEEFREKYMQRSD